MRIGISINEVLRDFLGQFIYTYSKYIERTDLKEKDITDFDLTKFFKFSNPDDLNRFLYVESPLEIFGHADQLTDGLMGYFNHFLVDLKDEGYDVEIVSKEANKSIPATFFFLSKNACRIDKVRFVRKDIQEWDDIDILITANPIALQNKPNGKVSIKIKSPYNTNVAADYELDSISDIIKDATLRDKVLKSKITTYEEI